MKRAKHTKNGRLKDQELKKKLIIANEYLAPRVAYFNETEIKGLNTKLKEYA